MSPDQTFKPGDTVELKSGGPIMTIESISNDLGAHCKWFEGTDLKTGTFKLAMLNKFEPGKVALGGA